MYNRLFVGQSNIARPTQPVDVPNAEGTRRPAPNTYLADEGLIDAVNVALMLGQPLLLTGEPGTGKTQLAHALAWELGWESPLLFETKTSSAAKDLFYLFDTLGRFHAAQAGQQVDPRQFMTFQALGLALIRAYPPAEVKDLLPDGFEHPGVQRSVVLIDEIDKAPRDFPNDLLNELDRMTFTMPELGGRRLTAPPEQRPVVVITSNSEKALPDAFLRRCVFYHLPFPDAERLEAIITARLPHLVAANNPLVKDAIEFLTYLREDADLRKRPSTAELLDFLVVMVQLGAKAAQSLRAQKDAAQRSLSTLSKIEEDQREIVRLFEEFIQDGES